MPNLDLPREALGDNLALLLETKTCLIAREDRVMWRIRISGLLKLDSALRQKFCAEALGTIVDVDDFARICAVETPPARSKYRGASARSAGKVETEEEHTPPQEEREHGRGNGTNPVAVVEPAGAETGPPAKPAKEGPELLAFLRMLLERTEGAVMPAAARAAEEASSSPPASASASSMTASDDNPQVD